MPRNLLMAFGDSGLTKGCIQRALAQFEGAMVSTASRWDTGFAANFNAALPNNGVGLPIASFSAEENRGRALFVSALSAGVLWRKTVRAGVYPCLVCPNTDRLSGHLIANLKCTNAKAIVCPNLDWAILNVRFCIWWVNVFRTLLGAI